MEKERTGYRRSHASALTFNEARPQDSGNYTVVVGNAAGNITSTVAQLVVDSLMKTVPTGTYRINSDPSTPGTKWPLSAYMIDMYEVRMSYWEEVYEWATQNGYAFTNPGLEHRSAGGSPKRGSPGPFNQLVRRSQMGQRPFRKGWLYPLLLFGGKPTTVTVQARST